MSYVCRFCGTPVGEGARFCTECGAPMTEENKVCVNNCDTSADFENDNGENTSDIGAERENTERVQQDNAQGTEFGNGHYGNVDPNGGGNDGQMPPPPPPGWGGYGAPNNGDAPYGGAPYGWNYGPYNAPPRPFKTEALLLVIFNFVLGCTCVGIIFGIAGIVFALMAKKARLDADADVYNKISVILSVIGLVLSVLVVSAVFASGASSLAFYY